MATAELTAKILENPPNLLSSLLFKEGLRENFGGFLIR
jgi:hypothetical protein